MNAAADAAGLTAVLVDDERLARTELRRLLAAHPEISIVGEAASAEQARAVLAAQQPDLLFLDIELPGESGFELLQGLDDPPHVIFSTAYDAHALRAFEVGALDYLLKPIEPRRLAEALRKVVAQRAAAASAPAPQPGAPLQRVFVQDGERCSFIQLREVRLLESEGNYTTLYCGTQRPLLLRSLSYLEERLDPRLFFRASRRHLINLEFIESIEKGPEGRLAVQLRGGPEIEMSRRQSQKFKDVMSP